MRGLHFNTASIIGPNQPKMFQENELKISNQGFHNVQCCCMLNVYMFSQQLKYAITCNYRMFLFTNFRSKVRFRLDFSTFCLLYQAYRDIGPYHTCTGWFCDFIITISCGWINMSRGVDGGSFFSNILYLLVVQTQLCHAALGAGLKPLPLKGWILDTGKYNFMNAIFNFQHPDIVFLKRFDIYSNSSGC